MKQEFKPYDFSKHFSHFNSGDHEFIAYIANKLLSEIKEAWKAEMLKDAPKVYLKLKNIDGGLTKKQYYCATQIGNNDETHTANLFNIEPIVKAECVKHEADLFGTRKHEDSFTCIHCGLELVAEWKVKT